jgi:hypothetical protein
MVYPGAGVAGLKVKFKFIEFKLLVQVDCVVVGTAFGCGFTFTVSRVVLVMVPELATMV